MSYLTSIIIMISTRKEVIDKYWQKLDQIITYLRLYYTYRFPRIRT